MPASRPRTNLWYLQQELAALGLKPGATADEITAAVRRKYPQGTSMLPIDPRTGLPYTQETGRAAGAGNVAGQVTGSIGLGLLAGGTIDRIIAVIRGGGLPATEGGFAGVAAGSGTEIGGAGAGGAGGGTGGAAEAGGGAAGAGLAAAGAGVGVIASLSDTLDFLKWIAWLFHPLNLLRAVEFLTGLALMFYGLHTLTGVMRRGAATHRTNARSIWRGLWGATPIGREAKFASARRRGRRAGELQAERDVAYRGARQKRARATGAGKRTTPGSGTGGTGQGSSALE